MHGTCAIELGISRFLRIQSLCGGYLNESFHLYNRTPLVRSLRFLCDIGHKAV